MRDAEMREHVLLYYRKVMQRNPGYYPVRMAELAPGVVAVEDGAHECDVFFDTEQWQYASPQLWRQVYPKFSDILPRDRSLGVIPGVGRRSAPVSTIEAMAIFVKTHLAPRGSQAWYDAPRFFFQIGAPSR